MSRRTQAAIPGSFETGNRTNEAERNGTGNVMVRRWSKAEMWVPGAYLALVAAMLVYVAVGSRTGDIGMFAAWPILATAPVSLLLLPLLVPAPDTLDSDTPLDPQYEGSEPPAKLPTDYPSESAPLPEDWVAQDTSAADDPSMWAGLGFGAVILVSALVNATAIWSLLRYVARRRAARSPQA